MPIDIASKVEAALELAQATGMHEARKKIKAGLQVPEEEFEEAFKALRRTSSTTLVRPDVWAYAMHCIAAGIKSLKLKGKTCQEPLEPSPISPTKSSE